MSLASKATAFVLGTAGVLTVTAGLIFGAVLTSMGREGAERQAAAALVQAEQLAIEELSTELALADEVPTAVAPASSPTPKDQTPSEPSGKRTTVHQLKGLTPELRDKLKKYVEDLGADVSVHIATESFVVRADQETHRKFSQEINKQRQAIADAETAIHEGKQLLADKQKTLSDDHPEVQRLQAELREKQLFLDTTRAVGTTSHDPLGDETSNLGESPRQQRSETEHREVPAIDHNRQSPSVARTTTITLPETSLSLQPQEIVLLKFPGTVAQAEVQYDRAIDVTPVSGKPDQLRVRGTGDGSCVLTAILANDAVHQVRFQVGTTPAHRFRDLSPAEARILRALSEQVSLEFLDNTLNVALDFITQLKGIPIIIDNDALKAAGVDGNSKVNVVISGITLRSALKLLLEESGLDYCIDKEVLVITTPAGFKERKRLDYYKLSSFSKEGQAAAERFITPLAISVASIEGDLLVDASLDAHRQLEEFLDKAYKLETQKPARPVELGMESTSRSSLSPPPSDPEVAAQTEQVFYDLLVFQADDDAIQELATPVTGGWTPKPTFQEQLTKLTSAKDKKFCPTEILSRPRVTTMMGRSAAIQIGSQIEVDGLKEPASTGINIQLTPLEIDSDGNLLTKVEFESSRAESGRVRGDRHLTTVRLPMNSTGTIVGFELKDGPLPIGRTYLLVSDVALRRDGGVPPGPRDNQIPEEAQRFLTTWKAKSAGVRDFSGSFKRLEFDSIFATETRSQGRLMFERPDSGRIEFGPADAAWLQKPGRVTQDGKPYKIVSGEASTWLSTGTSAYALSTKEKAYYLFDIPPAIRGRYLDTLPPHSQFGMQPPPLNGSYRFELGQLHNPDGLKRDASGQAIPKAIHIVAICQAPQSDRGLKPVRFLGLDWPVFRVPSDTLEYLLDPDTYLPLSVRTLDQSGNKETVYTFDHSSMKINAGFGALHPNPFQRPNLTGWTLMHHIKDKPDPAQEQPVTPNAKNEPIALSIRLFETTEATVEGLTVESSGKRVPKEGFGKLLDAAVREVKAKMIMEPTLATRLGKPAAFLAGGEFVVPIDGDQTKKSNYRPFGNQFTLTPHRRSAEGLFVEISGELSTLNPGKNNGNKGADLPTVEGQIIRAFVTIPGSTHEAIVGPIWKANAASPNKEMVGTYLWIREDAVPVDELPTAVEPPAPTLISPDSKTTDDTQIETIARVIDLTELPQTTPSEVAEALKLLIEPESWNGTRDIKPLGKSIIVRNTREIVDRCSEAVAEMIAKQQKPTAQ